MRKIIYSLCILSSLGLILYSLNFFCNERMISKMRDNIFDNNEFAWLGFMEPWVEPYNLGNSYFKQKKYEKAIEEYDKALDIKTLPEKKECDVRVNKALSMVIPIDTDNVTKENRRSIIELLEKAMNVLTEDECATDDGNGHDEEAQTLYDEIKEYKEELEKEEEEEQEQEQEQQDQQDQQNDGSSDDQDQNQQDQGDEEQQDGQGNTDEQDGQSQQDQQAQEEEQRRKDQELKDQLAQIQDDANSERADELGAQEATEGQPWTYSGDVW